MSVRDADHAATGDSPAGSRWAGSPVCLYGLYLGLGATTGANFLGACCCETEMLALPREGVVSILAATCPLWLLPWFHMVLEERAQAQTQTLASVEALTEDRTVEHE